MGRVKYLKSAIRSPDLAQFDYAIFRFDNSVEVAQLKVKNEIRKGFAKVSSVASPITDFYTFDHDNDFDIITDFIEDILEYLYENFDNVKDKYLVLNYLAFLLVDEDLNLYYKGNNLPMQLLLTELYASKRSSKLILDDYKDLVSYYRLNLGKKLFNKIIKELRLEKWNTD